MKFIYTFLLLFIYSNIVYSQIIEKPVGCFAGTNGTNPAVLSHTEANGVLLTEKWADIETSPGHFDFTALNAKINTVKASGLKYSLAIPAGAFGSPSWLIDSLNVTYHNFQYQNQNWRLPLWWDTVCQERLSELIEELGSAYASDSMLSHIYVSQMSVNGVEGHLNGVVISDFTNDGFTMQKWITAAKTTINAFADAFSNKPIVFEVHEIDNDTVIPVTIVNDILNQDNLCERFGLGMWWISGKTSYQNDLINFIENYEGDKYAQVIGRSDQVERFQDSLYSTVFTQAKNLNIRYIEPWPYEFQHHTNDSLLIDFNEWAKINFNSFDTCSIVSSSTQSISNNQDFKTNIFIQNDYLFFKTDISYENLLIELYNTQGQCVLRAINKTKLNMELIPKAMYFVKIKLDNKIVTNKIILE